MFLTTNDGRNETIVTPAKDAYQTEIETMEACLLDGAAPQLPFHLSRMFLRSVLALYQSAETGKLVTP
jgi:predicted dehydrogenase